MPALVIRRKNAAPQAVSSLADAISENKALKAALKPHPEHCSWCDGPRKPTCTDRVGLSHWATDEAYQAWARSKT